MFLLLLICFFFLPATACDEFEGKRKLYVNPLETTMASDVHITPGERYSVFYGNNIEYRAQIFKESNQKCSLLVHGDSSVIVQSLPANLSVSIIKRACLSPITNVSACDELEGKQTYVNPLETSRASKVEITPGKKYSVFYGCVEYRTKIFENYPKCSLLVHGASSVIEQSLPADLSVSIMERAWLSHITNVLDYESDIASKISIIGDNPEDFAMRLGKGFELDAVIHHGRKECHVWTNKNECFYIKMGSEELYDSVKQRFIGKEGQGKDLFAVLGLQ